jgi:hypothetical protein
LPEKRVFKNNPFKKTSSHDDLTTAEQLASQWTIERLKHLIRDRSQDGSVNHEKRLLLPVVHESLFVQISTPGPDDSRGTALAEKWSFVLTKPPSHSVSSHALSSGARSEIGKGITIDENYFQPDSASVQHEQTHALVDKIHKLSTTLHLSHLLDRDKTNTKPRYFTSFTVDRHMHRDWPAKSTLHREHIKTQIYEIGTIEVEVESISEYDLVANIQKDLQDSIIAKGLKRPSFQEYSVTTPGMIVEGRARLHSDNI